MSYTRDEVKPFWKGWKENIRHVLEEDTLWAHLVNLIAIPFWPILWVALILWLPEKRDE